MIKAGVGFSFFCGLGMLLTWVVLFITGQVPEMSTQPFHTTFLLAAEFLTAFSLLSAGCGLLTRRRWGLGAELVALGMLVYCAVYSIGVFGQEGNTPATEFFLVIAILALVFSGNFILKSAKGV